MQLSNAHWVGVVFSYECEVAIVDNSTCIIQEKYLKLTAPTCAQIVNKKITQQTLTECNCAILLAHYNRCVFSRTGSVGLCSSNNMELHTHAMHECAIPQILWVCSHGFTLSYFYMYLTLMYYYSMYLLFSELLLSFR